MEGVGRWARDASTSSASLNELLNNPKPISRPSTPPVEITKADAQIPEKPVAKSQLRQLALPSSPRLAADPANAERKASLPQISSVLGGIGSFWSARAAKLSLPRTGQESPPNNGTPGSATSAVFDGVTSPPVTRHSDELHPRSPYPTIIADTP